MKVLSITHSYKNGSLDWIVAIVQGSDKVNHYFVYSSVVGKDWSMLEQKIPQHISNTVLNYTPEALLTSVFKWVGDDCVMWNFDTIKDLVKDIKFDKHISVNKSFMNVGSTTVIHAQRFISMNIGFVKESKNSLNYMLGKMGLENTVLAIVPRNINTTLMRKLEDEVNGLQTVVSRVTGKDKIK